MTMSLVPSSLLKGISYCPRQDTALRFDKLCYLSPFLCLSFSFFFQLIQNQETESNSWKLYHRRFVTRFTQKDSQYIPTIVCYDTIKKRLEVRRGGEKYEERKEVLPAVVMSVSFLCRFAKDWKDEWFKLLIR